MLGLDKEQSLDAVVEASLDGADLWDEVKGDLGQDALSLSLGQQQRLCIARVIAVKPEVILMDEPCSALDPVATLQIEELMRRLKQRYTIVIVTHNMQQAARVSDYTGFFWVDDSFAEAREHVLVEHVDAASHVDLAGVEAEPEAGRVPRLLLALPEEDIEVGFIRPLVLRKPDVTVHTGDRAVDLRGLA